MLRVFLLGLMTFVAGAVHADEAKKQDPWEEKRERALLIPGNKGIEFFLGEWVETTDLGQYTMITLKNDEIVTVRDGQISPFKILASNERYVLMLIAEKKEYLLKGKTFYDFVQLSIERRTIGSSAYYMRWRQCVPYGDDSLPRYSAEDFARSPEGILELLRTDPKCGPRGKGRHKGEGIFAIHDDSEARYIRWSEGPGAIPFEPDEPRSKEEIYGRPEK